MILIYGKNTVLFFGLLFWASGCARSSHHTWDTCVGAMRLPNSEMRCRTYQIPAEAGTRNVYVKRLTPDGVVKRQLWLLMGGVGEPGTSALDSLMALLHREMPQTEIFTLDTYGSGKSNYLECAAAQRRTSEAGTLVSKNEIADCVAEMDVTDAQSYGVSRDADDLAWLIDAQRRADTAVLVWGGSAGSLLAQRLLLRYPTSVDGAVMEGIHMPGLPLLRHQQFCDEVGNAILSMCQSDEKCAAALPNPSEALDALYASLEAGHCSDLKMDRDQLAETLKGLLYYSPLHGAIPAFIYRLQRCNDDDVALLAPFIVRPPHGVDKTAMGQPKFHLWVCSESYWQPQTEGEQVTDFIEQVSGTTRFAGDWATDMKTWCDHLPVYTDVDANDLPMTDVPLLLMQGALDPATPVSYAREWATAVSGDQQHYVEFPYGAHNITLGTPYMKDGIAADCGLQLLVDFVSSPSAPLDKSCVEQTLPPDFSGDRFAGTHLGIDDLWENE